MSFVRFEPGAVCLPGLDADADERTVRQKGAVVSLIFGTTDDYVLIVCNFTAGQQTGVGFWLKTDVEAQEEAIRAYEQTILREAEEKAAKLAKDEADRAAHAAWHRSAPPDEVLLHWAKSYSAWGVRR
ncbi:hypothetical protein EEB11_09725 [Pseudotabrizicola sediminis]|uniref:Uncharacterized protein n=1 Tax=Pseudotabrizicola sediminis TaxID=2486418 RepID=A0ABY2KMB2_9RHOB|nr:hypothetical protein [Pseudotabrizicola sediminis]TGD43645.1 hypothetical protein EEB11_09725 [Pseudotabrizicola sediminis]